MSESIPQKLSLQEKTAMFAKVMDATPPAESAHPTVADRLNPFRSLIVKYHRSGRNLQQIINALATPGIDITVSESALQKYLTALNRRRAASKTANAAISASPAPAPAK